MPSPIPSSRHWAGIYHRSDYTLFYNLAALMCLHPFRNSLTPELREKHQRLSEETTSLLPVFRNKDQEPSYNFWPTQPPRHFPNGYFAHRFRLFQIPDDTDDSCLAYTVLSLPHEENEWLQHKLQRYANGKIRLNTSLPDLLMKLPAYNTFFIKNMPSNMDAVVLCNALYWLMESKHPCGLHEEACADYVRLCIKHAFWIKCPARVAAYYPRSALFAYHFSRLAVRFPHLFKNSLIEQFSNQLDHISKTKSFLYPHDRLLLELSRCRMNMPFNKVLSPMPSDRIKYPFYVAGLCGEFHSNAMQKLNRLAIAQIHYRSPGFAEYLELEFRLCMQQKLIS